MGSRKSKDVPQMDENEPNSAIIIDDGAAGTTSTKNELVPNSTSVPSTAGPLSRVFKESDEILHHLLGENFNNKIDQKIEVWAGLVILALIPSLSILSSI
jgi:hypothetical protein